MMPSLRSPPEWLVKVALGVSALAILAVSLQQLGPSEPRRVHPMAPLPATPLRPATAPQRFTGVLVANEAVTLSAGVEGPVAELHVAVGDRVKAGALLVTLGADARRQELAMAVARRSGAEAEARAAAVRHKRASAQRTRHELLVEHVSAGELEKARYDERLAVADLRAASAGVEEARAHVEQLQQLLAQAEVRAPFDGVVAQRFIERGAWVEPSSPLVRIIGVGGLKLRFALPESEVASAKPGSRLAVRLEGRTDPLTGELTAVSPEVDLGARRVMCEASLSIPPGAQAQAQALAGQVVSVSFVDRTQLAFSR